MISPLPSKSQTTPSRWGLFWIGIVILIVVFIIFGSAVYAESYTGRVFPGVHIGSLDLGGRSFEEAKTMLDTKIDELLSNGFVFYLDGHEVVLSFATLAPEDPDMTRELVNFDRTAALDEAFGVGRGSNIFQNIFKQLQARSSGITIKVPVQTDLREFERVLREKFSDVLRPVKNAQIVVSWSEEKNPIISILPETPGTSFDVGSAWTSTESAIKILNRPEINLAIVSEKPEILESEARSLIPKVQNLLLGGAWTLEFEGAKWSPTAPVFSSLLTIRKDSGGTYLTFGGDSLDSFFESIETVINRLPENAKFAMENGKVVEFWGSQDGVALDRELTTRLMEDIFIAKAETKMTIATKISPPETTTSEVNDLGIETKLGVGVSNFRGSPANRIKNIRNGARLLNGILIKPGEEFSLLGALRPFTSENGYLPELVIKGDKIEPEIGGGLCQIGTTMFRATMNSGLPITKRQNHSLVVSYYNDPVNNNPGTDATIYDPAPDFRFMNDTGAYLLLTTEMDMTNSELRFTLWGRSDGRKGYYSAPTVLRWIPTGEAKTIETTDLEPGQKKCQSRHPGADTSFTYTIERPDGKKEETVYESHYRPLPEICLVGVETLSVPTTPETTEDIPSDLTPVESADISQ